MNKKEDYIIVVLKGFKPGEELLINKHTGEKMIAIPDGTFPSERALKAGREIGY